MVQGSAQSPLLHFHNYGAGGKGLPPAIGPIGSSPQSLSFAIFPLEYFMPFYVSQLGAVVLNGSSLHFFFKHNNLSSTNHAFCSVHAGCLYAPSSSSFNNDWLSSRGAASSQAIGQVLGDWLTGSTWSMSRGFTDLFPLHQPLIFCFSLSRKCKSALLVGKISLPRSLSQLLFWNFLPFYCFFHHSSPVPAGATVLKQFTSKASHCGQWDYFGINGWRMETAAC